MSASEITDQLDKLADEMSAAVDSGREPNDELVSEYAELLNAFVTEHPTECVNWLREIYGRAA
jgi:hypothetical protein